MRSRWFGGVGAALLAVGIAVAPAQPAQAGLDDFFDDVVDAIENIYGIGDGGGGGGPDPQLEAAKREIIAAVNAAKQEILDHIDGLAEGEVRTCTNTAVTFFEQIDAMPPELLGPFVNGAVSCSHLSVAYFNAVQSLPAADNIGKLMGVTHAIAMASFTKYGLSITDLVTSLVSGYEAVVTRLTPTNCVIKRIPGSGGGGGEPPMPPERWWECTAYNGDVGTSGHCFGFNCQPNLAAAENNATRNTSRATAVAALPRLRALLA